MPLIKVDSVIGIEKAKQTGTENTRFQATGCSNLAFAKIMDKQQE